MAEVPLYTSKRREINWKRFENIYLEAKARFSQGQNLALTVLCVLDSLDSI
jgi:hypothetical protein